MTRGLKPGGVGVDADSGFNEAQELVPDILGALLTANLSCGRHRNEKSQILCYFLKCG
jgi:hypothetical protein